MGADELLGRGLDRQRHPLLVGQRPAQHDDPAVDERVHEGGVRVQPDWASSGSPGRQATTERRRVTRYITARSLPAPGAASTVVGDAEGATKVVRVEVVGAADDDDADRGARAIARSQLTKCSWFGEDPYWGRVASDLGSADIAFDLDRFSIAYGGVVVAAKGIAVEHDVAAVAAHMGQRHLRVTADLGLGDGEAFVLSNDLTYGYIDENKGTS